MFRSLEWRNLNRIPSVFQISCLYSFFHSPKFYQNHCVWKIQGFIFVILQGINPSNKVIGFHRLLFFCILSSILFPTRLHTLWSIMTKMKHDTPVEALPMQIIAELLFPLPYISICPAWLTRIHAFLHNILTLTHSFRSVPHNELVHMFHTHRIAEWFVLEGTLMIT